MTRRARYRTGFTLVETALAMLAISIGLLGIFGLARHGLKASGDADEETRCAILADTVFASLRAKNDELAEKKETDVKWWTYWGLFAKNRPQAPIYLPQMSEIYEGTEPLKLAINEQHTFVPFVSPSGPTTLIKWSPTYDLLLTITVPNPIYSLKDIPLERVPQEVLEVLCRLGFLDEVSIDVMLRIHPGALLSGGEVRTYYTVLNYTGGLP